MLLYPDQIHPGAAQAAVDQICPGTTHAAGDQIRPGTAETAVEQTSVFWTTTTEE